MLGGTPDHVAENADSCKVEAGLKAIAPAGVRVIKADFSRFVEGDPRVAMEWRGGAIFVGLTSVPWGWADRARPCEFYDERSAYIHAARLQRAIAKAGAAERDRREAKRIARHQEREAAR
jgi:hypothetical protein